MIFSRNWCLHSKFTAFCSVRDENFTSLKILHAMNEEDPDHKPEYNELFLCRGEENKSFLHLFYLIKVLSDLTVLSIRTVVQRKSICDNRENS
jgi:hypothetical protein